MAGGVNQSYLRVKNQRSVLDAVLKQGPVSKAELARLLGASKPAMADNVSRLMEIGIFTQNEDNPGGKSGSRGENAGPSGRRPVLLDIKKDFRFIITIDFTYLNTRFDLFNLKGEGVSSFSVKQTPSQKFGRWVSMCVNAAETLLNAQNLDPGSLAAIGISSPGIINEELDEVTIVPLFGEFNPLALRKHLAEQFGCPVYIRNSTNAAALGEYAEGAGRGSVNMLYISCGQGLGAGIILDGKIYEGSCRAAGEIANFITKETLGLEESLEKRIGIDGLLDRFLKEPSNASRLPREGGMKREALFENVLELWRKGDPFIAGELKNIAFELGVLICDMVMLLNCDHVVLGGEYHVFSKDIIPEVANMIQKHCIVPAGVAVSRLGERAAGVGMAAVCREIFFDCLCEVKE
ncbi:MAG: ROK family transcriptional regulator [Treponema sp.]|jgi:predicted NBD/HSP70 family sugar kinase|nr:ROK family transcriptional regulator [Treponema sp.]